MSILFAVNEEIACYNTLVFYPYPCCHKHHTNYNTNIYKGEKLFTY